MIIFAGRTSLQAGGTRAGRRIEFEDTNLDRLVQESPDCQWILPEVGQNDVRIHSNFNASAQEVTGSYPPFAEIRSVTVGEGRFYDWNDVANERVAFLGTEVKKLKGT
jgi:putative ABC transport system permease protein